MERLTERTADGILVKENYEKETLKNLYSFYGENPNPHYTNCEEGYCAMEKLADYEDAEEQGRLIKLPCKVGDTYYSIEVNTGSCEECHFFQKGYYGDDLCTNKAVLDEEGDTLINPQYSDKVFCKKHFYEINKCCFDDVDEIFNLRKCFGKTIFHTESEAESKLKELRGGENGR